MDKKKYFYLSLIFLSSALLMFFYSHFFQVEKNILNALNRDYFSKDFMQVYEDYEKDLSKEFIFLIGEEDAQALREKVDVLEEKMNSSNYFERVVAKTSKDLLIIPTFYYQRKLFLLTDEQKKLIENNSFDLLKQMALEKIYSPISAGASSFQIDPFLLMDDFFGNLVNPTTLSFDHSYLSTEGESPYLVIRGKIKPKYVKEALALFESFKEESTQFKILYSSIGFYGVSALEKAQEESQAFSIISFILILAIFLFYFKTLRHLLVTLGGIVFCSTLALYIVSFFLGPMHILSFLLGISILGIMADYFIHYYFKEFDENIKDGKEAFFSIKRPLGWSLITTFVGFSIFCLSNITLLRQFGAFCILSLLITFFFIKLFLKNFFVKSEKKNERNLFNIQILRKYYSKKMNVFLIILLAVSLLSLLRTNIHNDIRSFADSDPKLKVQEEEIRNLLGVKEKYDLFIVKGESFEKLLINEEELKKNLANHNISNHSVSAWIPSQKSQEESFELYQKLKTPMEEFLAELALKNSKRIIENTFKPSDKVNLDRFKEHFPSHEVFKEYRGEYSGYFYSVVPLFGHDKELDFFKSFKSEKWVYVSKIDFINQDISVLSQRLAMGFFGFAIIFYLLLMIKFTLKKASLIFFPPLFAQILSLNFAYFFSGEINLFHLLASVLILALGLDYSFFFFFNKKNAQNVGHSITLSAITTLCSFGVLFFSSTHAVSSFGQVVFFGIVISWFFAPLSYIGNSDEL